MNNIDRNDHGTSWGIYINHSSDLESHPSPQWVKGVNHLAWARVGVVIWDEIAGRVFCMSPQQALDVLDELRESSAWKETPFCLNWDSYSMPFSEQDRIAWRTTKNRRNPSVQSELRLDCLILSARQTQELFLFLEQHENEIRELSHTHTREVRKILGQVYSIIIRWGRERESKNQNPN